MRLGRYTLVRRVGSGGMAEVWKAVFHGPEGFSKAVAIKRVLPHLAADREFVEMFVREAKLVARLVHPNIVQVFDFGVVPGNEAADTEYFLALEYVNGENVASLRRRLKDAGRTIPVNHALYIAAEAAKALAFAHSMEIVHSDVSPHNLLVSWNGEAKVADFGIARVGVTHAQSDGVLRGKASYFSPEQAALGTLDARSDIFSLGLVLFEMITGERLFQGETADEVIKKVAGFTGIENEKLFLLPQEIRPIITRALMPAPVDRYADANAFEAALTTPLGPGGSTAARLELAALIGDAFADEKKFDLDEKTPTGDVPVVEYITGEREIPKEILGVAEGWSDRTAAATRVVRPRNTDPSITMVSPKRDDDPPSEVARPIAPPSGEAPSIAVVASERGAAVPPPPDPPAPAVVSPEIPEIAAVAVVTTQAPVVMAIDAVIPSPRRDMAPSNAPIERATIANLPSLAAPPSLKGKPTLVLNVGKKKNGGRWVFAMFALVIIAIGGWRMVPWSESSENATETPSPGTTLVAIAGSPLESAATPEETATLTRESAIATATAAPAATATAIVRTTSTPRATATPKSRVTASATHVAKSSATQTARATPKPTRTAVAANGESGWLTVLADPWVEVYINGKRVAAETPLRRYALAAGKYDLKVVNKGAGYKGEQSVEIEPGTEYRLFVDVSQKKIRLGGEN